MHLRVGGGSGPAGFAAAARSGPFQTYQRHLRTPGRDDALRKVSQQLRTLVPELVRDCDEYLLARYGGEELAVLLVNVPEAGAHRIAETLRFAVDSLEIGYGDEAFGITASIGIATFPDHAETIEELITHADSALYTAKENGRNQVVVSSDLSQSALFAV